MRYIRRAFLVLTLLFGPGILVAQPKQPSTVDSLKQQLTRANQDSTRLRICLSIAQYYYAKSQYDSLYPYVQQGIQLLTKAPHPANACELFFLQAWYYRSQGQYRKGIQPVLLAIRYAQQNGNQKRVVDLQYRLAVLYSDAGDPSRSIKQIGANLRYLAEHEDGPTRAANYLLLIPLFQALNDTRMEKLYFQKYMALDKRSWPAEDRLLAFALAGEDLEKKGKLKEAEGQFRKALYYARFTPTPDYRVVEILEALGINARKQQQYQNAITLFEQVFAKAKSIKNLSLMGSAKRELATTYMALQRPQDALKEARYALPLSRQNKGRNGVIASLNTLVTVLEAIGHHREALQLYREQQQLKEQRFTETNVQQIAQMQAQFEAETKEKTIKLLQKNAQIERLNTLRQQEQLALAKRTQLAGGLVIGLLILLISVIVYGLNKSRRDNVLLTRQQVLLQQTASQLAETNAVKDKLFSLIGHDLRSPVANMKNSLRQMQTLNQQTDHFRPLMDRLDKQVDNVLVLLTNLLDWSIIQLKGFQSTLQPVRLSDVTDEVISQASDLIEQKQLCIINHVNPVHLALADHHQIRAVVRNLLGNAIKFTSAGGYIRLVSLVAANRAELQIRDSGFGMSAEQIAALNTSPVIRAGTQGEVGTGLGLRICREMLERQNGSLQIQSQEGKGTFVRILLALAQETKQPNLPSVANKEA